MITQSIECADVGELAGAAELLSHWWSRPISAEVDSWIAWNAPGKALAEALGVTCLDQASMPTTVEDRRLCLDEYDRLFAGSGHVPCPPYESFWRDDVPPYLRRSLMGPCTEQLRGLYQELGLSVSKASGELPDQIAVEFEALAVALTSPHSILLAQKLLSDHLTRWLPKFCRAVAAAAGVPYYRNLAMSTSAWLPVLTDCSSTLLID